MHFLFRLASPSILTIHKLLKNPFRKIANSRLHNCMGCHITAGSCRSRTHKHFEFNIMGLQLAVFPQSVEGIRRKARLGVIRENKNLSGLGIFQVAEQPLRTYASWQVPLQNDFRNKLVEDELWRCQIAPHYGVPKVHIHRFVAYMLIAYLWSRIATHNVR